MKSRAAGPVMAALLLCLGLSCGCEKKYADQHPILDKPVEELTREEMSRLAVKFRTNQGEFVIEIVPEWGPKTAKNFLELVKQGFYLGLSFHEVRPGFMIAAGDPEGTGEGGPGYSIPIELPSGPHLRGVVGSWHPLGNPMEGGSIFYIMLSDLHAMNGAYTVFGRVVAGMPTVDRIGSLPVTPPNGKPQPYMPLSKVVIEDTRLLVETGEE